MLPERESPVIEVDELPVMEWQLEELVAEGELRYLTRHLERLEEVPKAYDIAPDVDDERRKELRAMIRQYAGHRN